MEGNISMQWFAFVIMLVITIFFYINRNNARQEKCRKIFLGILGVCDVTIAIEMVCFYMKLIGNTVLLSHPIKMLQIICFVGSVFLISVFLLILYVTNEFGAALGKKERMMGIYILFGVLVAVKIMLPDIMADSIVLLVPCLTIYLLFVRNNIILDEIFGINKRKLYLEKLKKLIDKKEPFSIIMVSVFLHDMEGKQIALEDMPDFLYSVTKPLKREVEDKVLFAITEEKIAYIKSMSEQQIQQAIDKLRSCFSGEIQCKGKKAKMECRICVAYYPEDGKTEREIMDNVWRTVLESTDGEDGEVCYINQYSGNQQKRIQRLEEQKKLLENMTKEAKQAKKEAEVADIAKSTFLANMSREIRTPLNTILGMTELILREESDKQIKENAWNIKNAGQSLLSLINNILDISQMDLGKMELHFEEYNMKRMLQDIINMATLQIGEKDIEFIVDIDHTIPRYLLGDEVRVRQVFVNLLNNAAQYTESGFIRFSVQCTYSDDNVILLCSVEDSGDGIREQMKDKIFEFGTAEEAKQNVTDGTGLGLVICKQALDVIGGTIDVQSEYGKGSCFTATIPQKCSSRQETLVTLHHRDAYRVLFFEKSKEQEKIARKVFQSFLVESDYVSTPDEFLAMLSQRKYTHLFVTKPEYEKQKDMINKLKTEKTDVLVIKEYGEVVKEEDGAVFLYRPLQCINLIYALNEELYNMNEERTYHESFTAPEGCVLIVDDNEANLRVTEGLLEPYKLKILKAGSGEECLDILKKRQDINMVYLDYMMAEMDGIETIRQIRQFEGAYYKDLPVVAMTVNLFKDVLRQFTEEGFQGYIAKPIDVKQLEKSLLKWLPESYIKKRMVTGQTKKPCALQIEGIDTEAGLKQCNGVMKRYKSILEAVYEDGTNKLSLIQQYFDEKKYHEYMIEVHGLKGVCANVGMHQLSQMAKKQEFAVKENRLDDVEEFHENFMLYYKTMMLRIAEALHLQENRELQEFHRQKDEMEFEKRLELVVEMIQSYEDEEAIHEMKAMIEEYGQQYPVFFLSDAIEKLQKLDYSEAERLISNWRRLQDEEDIISRR